MRQSFGPTNPQANTSQDGGRDPLQAGEFSSERDPNSPLHPQGAAQETSLPTSTACAPVPPSVASPLETPVLAGVSSTALPTATTVTTESPQSTALPAQSSTRPTPSIDLGSSAAGTSADVGMATSSAPVGVHRVSFPDTLSGRWLCPLRPPPLPFDPETLTLPLKREQRAIRSQKECVCWFKSCGKGHLLSPPDSWDAYDSPLQIADLYIHQYDYENVHQIHIWMWTGHSWDAVQPNCTHPTMPGYRLKILDKGEPSWVTRKTMVSDQGRAKRRSENK